MACGLRRHEIAELTLDHLQKRDWLSVPTPPEELVELRQALGIQAHDFAPQRGLAGQVDVDAGAQIREALVYIAATGDGPSLIAADVCQLPEAIHLQLEDVVLVNGSSRWIKSAGVNCGKGNLLPV